MQSTNKKFEKPDAEDKVSIDKMWRIPHIDLVAPAQQTSPYKETVDTIRLKALVTAHAEKLDDSEGIMELLPDLELVKETLIASILSPKDLKEVKLNLKIHKEAPPEIAELVREHFTNEYDLDSQMGTILGSALFTKGSHIMMPVPPTAIRSLITQNTYGLESIALNHLQMGDVRKVTLPNTGILFDPTVRSYAMEEISQFNTGQIPKNDRDKELLEISDNVMYLLYPTIKASTSKHRVQTALKNAFGLEGIADDAANSKEIPYNKNTAKNLPFVNLPMGDPQNEVFNPVVLTLPPESLIPVHVPGEPSNHIGYYVFLDEEGNPIHLTLSSNKFKELNNRLNKTMENQTQMNNLSGLGISYPNTATKANELETYNKQLLQAYNERFEEKLKEAVAKGATGRTVDISNPGELYRIMFARQLEKQKTRVIYVPAEMVSYIAFNYNESGVGISLLEKTKLYASFRAILTFATVMASVASSINRRTLSINLDEDEPNPAEVVDHILGEYIALQASGLPLGRLSAEDIVDSLQKSGIQVKVSGATRFPAMEMDVAETKREITPPDSAIMDMLKEVHYSGLWVNPETIGKTVDVDFATSITSANLLQAKRVQGAQQEYIKHLSGFIHKYIYMGGPLFKKIKAKYDEVADSISLSLEEVIDSLEVALPRADTAVIKTQYESWTEYCQFVGEAIEVYISEGMMKDMLSGEHIGVSIEDAKAMALAMLKRQYLRSENMLPELDALINDEDDNIGDMLSQHNDLVVKLVGEVLRHTKATEHKDDEKTTALMEKLEPQETENNDAGGADAGAEGSTDTGDGMSESGDADQGFSDDTGGDFGGDFGGDDSGLPEETTDSSSGVSDTDEPAADTTAEDGSEAVTDEAATTEAPAEDDEDMVDDINIEPDTKPAAETEEPAKDDEEPETDDQEVEPETSEEEGDTEEKETEAEKSDTEEKEEPAKEESEDQPAEEPAAEPAKEEPETEASEDKEEKPVEEEKDDDSEAEDNDKDDDKPVEEEKEDDEKDDEADKDDEKEDDKK